jgi:hypothetical protein
VPLSIGDHIDHVSLARLELDPENPRIPLALRDASQESLLVFIEAHYEPIVIARSLARHGFFTSEPLITIPGRRRGKLTVVEGNRRLTALKLLAESNTRALVDSAEWETLSADFQMPARGIPVVKAENREQVAPIIGYRHIAGIQEWDPFPKARFITRFVDDDKLSFAQVAELVGESEADIRRFYRNFGVVEQARTRWGIDTSRVEADFGVFDRALTGGIREYIEAPVPSSITERYWPLPESSQERVRELFSWIFGDEAHESVITDSRSLTLLGRVLREEDGRRVLMRTRDLSSAAEAASGTRVRLLNRLGQAVAGLKGAKQDLAAYKSAEEVRALVSQCQELLDELKNMLDA